ncbi:MAG: mechanosensitive ion channel domain-containing protein [Allorhizobium sp.]
MITLRHLVSLLALLALFALPPAAEAQENDQSTPQAATGVEDLIRILESEEARTALLTRLKTEAAAQASTEQPGVEATIARQVAEQTRAAAEQIVVGGNTVWTGLVALAAMITDPDPAGYTALRSIILNVVLVAAGLFASFLVLRLLVHPLQRSFDNRAAGRHWFVKATYVLVATVADVVTVALAWGVGYFLALQVVGGGTGQMDINQTLLLNAFLLVELIKVTMRLLLHPRFSNLRPIPVSDTSAAYWYFWLARIVSLIGYAFMFVAPIMATNVSESAAQAVRVLVMFTALVIGVVIILQNRDRVRHALSSRAAEGRSDFVSRSSALLAGIWHLLAIAYLFAIVLVWLVNPSGALPYMMAATLKSIVAIVVGGLVTAFIGRFANAGLRLPDDLRARLPALEARLKAFVPGVMQIIRAIVTFGVIIAIAQAWGLIDFLGWLASDSGQRVSGSTLAALIILLFGFVAYLAVSSWVEYRLNPQFGTIPTSREKTLLSLFQNAFTIALVVLVTMLALAQIGVNIAPLLAGAGVLGLAIGFGAQKLVQDIITGVFIQLENVMNEGDVVSLGNVSGVVERLTIRSVSIRSLDGTLHLIPFSSVDTVSNMMKGFSYHVAEIGVAYREDIAEVKEAMHEAFDLLMQSEWREMIVDKLDMHGVTAFGDSAVMVRARIKTVPGGHWATGRAYNELIKQVFDRRGIEIPFPHVTLYMGEDKAGMSPPLRVKDEVQSESRSADRPVLITDAE